MSVVRANTYQDASGGSNAVFSGVASPPNSMGFRNRILNGNMVIDQRNAGASVTPTADIYTLDRWLAGASAASKYSVQQNAGSVTPPVGFSNYLGVTSLSAYSVASGDNLSLAQYIEGFNFADLAWGTANAQTVTLSFWVRSSLTGTFGGAITNSALNRSYPFSYTISSANTWEQKVVTIAGDTTGTWVGSTNGVGARLYFGLGIGSTFQGTAGAWDAGLRLSVTGATSVVGTNGATFYITGVQLEAGTFTVAPQFERRDYGRELAMCERYCQTVSSYSGYNLLPGAGGITSATNGRFVYPFIVDMRAAPTAVFASAGSFLVQEANATPNRNVSAVALVGNSATTKAVGIDFTISSGSAGQPFWVYSNNTGVLLITLSSEL